VHERGGGGRGGGYSHSTILERDPGRLLLSQVASLKHDESEGCSKGHHSSNVWVYSGGLVVSARTNKSHQHHKTKPCSPFAPDAAALNHLLWYVPFLKVYMEQHWSSAPVFCFCKSKTSSSSRPIDPRMRLRLPRPSIKGLPSLLGHTVTLSLQAIGQRAGSAHGPSGDTLLL